MKILIGFPLADRQDYGSLNNALLHQFELNDQYEKKFRSERPRGNVAFVMY